MPSLPPLTTFRRRAVLRTWYTVWPWVLASATVYLGIVLAFDLMAAGRAYVAGESLWSKSQKDAVQHLAQYHGDCNPAHYERFMQALQMPLGDSAARQELLKPEPDLALAVAGLAQGGNDARDIPGMVRLFRWGRHVPLMREAIDIWSQADELLAGLQQAGATLAQDCRRGVRSEQAMAQVYALNARLTPLQAAFSEKLGEANRLVGWSLLIVLGGVSATLTLGGVALSARVVRSRLEAADALRASERRLQQALTGSNSGLWDLDLRSGSLYASGHTMQLLGRGQREHVFAPQEATALLHPEERSHFEQLLRQHVQTGDRLDEELRLRLADGTYRWFRIAGQMAAALRGGGSRLVGALHDVTEARELRAALVNELELRRTALRSLRSTLEAFSAQGGSILDKLPVRRERVEGATAEPLHEAREIEARFAAMTQTLGVLGAQLRASNERLQTILALSPDAFVSFNEQHRVVHVSSAFETLTGVRSETLLGLDAPDFERLLAALCLPDTPSPVGLLAGAPEAQAPARWMLELASTPPRSLLVERREGSHQDVRTVLCLRDVTREREVERMKSEFMSVAAHELRTPLASIYGFVELLLHRPFSQERRQELLGLVHRQCKLVVNTVDDLLDLSRLEARSGLQLQRAALAWPALVRETCQAFAPPPGRAAPVIDDQLGDSPAWIDGDADRLQRALGNLLSNAYKYSPAGGPVAVRLHRAGGVGDASAASLCVTITDQGIGMTPEQLARVGERFYRADHSGHIPGTGLGMSIVMEIARLHGGTLGLHSVPEVGTQATLSLPALPVPAAETVLAP